MSKSNNRTLVTIVIAQFCCTSIWFATNAVISPLAVSFGLVNTAVGDLTSAIQFGFIIGTLGYSILSIADRYSPSKVFFVSAVLAATSNLVIQFDFNSLGTLLLFRFATGFFLAGIYPVGMKIAADHFEKGLGKSLGFLVGALVLGTALPHLLKTFFTASNWQMVMSITSGLSVLGGLSIVLFVSDGPYRKAGQRLNLSALTSVFQNSPFRKAAFGYFGHMWELYTFWAFVPIILSFYSSHRGIAINSIPLLSFGVIAVGSLACISAGYISQRIGSRDTAKIALTSSALCCILSPVFMLSASPLVFYSFLAFWGFVVIADSPMLSTLVAQHAVPELKGTALTLVNCIGFTITIVSIQTLSILADHIPIYYLMTLLAAGPVAGLSALRIPKTIQS